MEDSAIEKRSCIDLASYQLSGQTKEVHQKQRKRKLDLKDVMSPEVGASQPLAKKAMRKRRVSKSSYRGWGWRG